MRTFGVRRLTGDVAGDRASGRAEGGRDPGAVAAGVAPTPGRLRHGTVVEGGAPPVPGERAEIDRSIVAAITGNGDGSGVIVRSTVALAHALGLEVIAEGTEDPVGLSRLRTLGCEYGQGFLFSKPLSAEETESLLASWSPSEAAALGEQVTPA